MPPVDLGPSAYAEAFDAATFLKMPANALVNLGYLSVGLLWLWRARAQPSHRRWFAAFGAMGAVYGGIQFTRIVTQHPLAAMLDQWATLPFFGVLVAWSLSLWRPDNRLAAPLIAGSVASYALAFLHPRGFELALALHIGAAVAACAYTLRAVGRPVLAPFVAAALGCLGFVVLKKLDFTLAEYAPFQRFTGHFWSKVADVAQLHCALWLMARAVAFQSSALNRIPSPAPTSPPQPPPGLVPNDERSAASSRL